VRQSEFAVNVGTVSDHGERIIELAVPWNGTERSTMRDSTECTLSERDVTFNEHRVTLNKKVYRTARNNINNAVTNITYDRVHTRNGRSFDSVTRRGDARRERNDRDPSRAREIP